MISKQILYLVDVKQFYDIWSSTDVSVEGILCVLSLGAESLISIFSANS